MGFFQSSGLKCATKYYFFSLLRTFHLQIAASNNEIVVVAAHPKSETPADVQKIWATTQKALTQLVGASKIDLPQVLFLEEWPDIIGTMKNKKPKIVHFVSHGLEGSDHPLAKEASLLMIGDGVDGNMLGNLFGNSESPVVCLLVMACHSHNLLKHMPEDKLTNIDHLVLCEGKLSDEESQQFSAGFYSALLHDELTIASSIRKGFERIGMTIGKAKRTVQLIYYSNGSKVDFESIELKKQNQKAK